MNRSNYSNKDCDCNIGMYNIGIYGLLFITFIIIFFTIIIIWYIIYLHTPITVEPVPNYVNHYPLKSCVLLTMYIGNDPKRLEMYDICVRKWLENTNLDIFVVDSSNQHLNIEHERLHQYSFMQNSHRSKSLTDYEKDSILRAHKHFTDEMCYYDFIFKITGKYYSPDFEECLNKIPSNAELIVQNQTITNGQNCEVIGIRSYMFRSFFVSVLGNMEKSLHRVLRKKKYKTYRLKPLSIHNKVVRSDGTSLKYL